MGLVLRSLEGAVAEFFSSHEGITRQQCDELAVSIVGGTVSPVAVQGSSTYTVESDDDPSKIVQFRDVKINPKTDVFDMARTVDGKAVPAYTFHGRLGDPQKLAAYSVNKTSKDTSCSSQGGVSVLDATCEVDSPVHKTVVDLALFYAESWRARQELAPEVAEQLRAEYEWRFDILSRVLPSRHQQHLQDVMAGLELLFEVSYPSVLNHGNVSDAKMLEGSDTSSIKSIVDWAGAKVSPFGISLWGVENILGAMNEKGWQYDERQQELRALFWRTFEDAVGGLSDSEKQAIKVARMAGLFLRYGFDWTDESAEPVREGTSSFNYLDAFCAQDLWVLA